MNDVNHEEFLRRVLPQAAAISMPYFCQQFAQIGGQWKPDQSPVTEADQQIEVFLRQQIQTCFPEDGILGEEYGKIEGTSGGQWIIDPIDGTKSFVIHNPLFGVLLGYRQHGMMQLGGAYLPALQQIWWSSQAGKTWCDGRECQASVNTFLSRANLSTTSPDLFDAQGLSRWCGLAQKVRFCHYGGDCNQYLWLASGGLDIVYEEGLKPFDIMPLIPIVRGAGGVITDRYGKSIDDDWDGSCLAAANLTLHHAALCALMDH